MNFAGIGMALGGAAAIALAISFALPAPDPVVVTPAVAAPVVAASDDGANFDTTWRDAAVPTAMKSAVLFGSFRSQMADRIAAPAQDAAAGVPPEAKLSSPLDTQPRRHAHKNICERHGMKKVKTGKGGWRCRR